MTRNAPNKGEESKRATASNPRKSISLNISQTEVTVTTNSVPSSAELREIEKLCPGAAKIIIMNAIEQSEHRRVLEKVIVKSNCLHEALGQWMAFLISIALILLSGYCLMKDYPGYAITIVSGTLASLLSVNFYGKHKSRKEIDEKRTSEEPAEKNRGEMKVNEVDGEMKLE